MARALWPKCQPGVVFQAMLVQLNASECLLASGDNTDRLRPIIERSGILITDRKKGDRHTDIMMCFVFSAFYFAWNEKTLIQMNDSD